MTPQPRLDEEARGLLRQILERQAYRQLVSGNIRGFGLQFLPELDVKIRFTAELDQSLRVLREVKPAKPLYYNLACTYALLGENETALAFLERELLENHPDASSRERQKDWTRRDPDLANLREDPRFQYLVE